MVDLHFDIAAAILIMIIMLSMIVRKVIRGTTNRLFFLILNLAFLGSISDIFSEFQVLSPTVRIIFNYFYFLFSVLIPLAYALYVYSSIGALRYLLAHKIFISLLSLPLLVTLAIFIANIYSPIAFTVTPEGQYVRGPLQPAIVLSALIYCLFGISIIFRWRKFISKERRIPLICFFPILFTVIFIQQRHLGLQVTMFGLAISLLICSFTVQRTDESIDKVSGIKSFDAAYVDFQKIFLMNNECRVILFKIINHDSLRSFFGSTNYNSVFLKNIANDIRNLAHTSDRTAEVYYLHGSTFAISSQAESSKSIENLALELSNKCKQPIMIGDVAISVNARTCLIQLPYDIDNLDSFMNFRFNFDRKLPDTKDVLTLSNFVESKEFKIKNDLDEIISRALKEHNFKMYYQPIYSIKEKKFVSSEALLRLNDSKYGFISPSIFIPAAEQSGAIHHIGDYVVESVFKFISRISFEQMGLEYIELNLSVSQCIEADLVDKIEELSKKYHVNPAQLNLEITETAEDFDPEIMDRNIKLLHTKGYTFSLDDYGTGYSNIKRVTELPLDIVKLDKSFVDEMDKPDMWSVIVNTVKMFKEMHKTILVEGVEDQKTFDAFVKLGCDYIQGFYFSKPLPEEEYIRFVKEHNRKNA